MFCFLNISLVAWRIDHRMCLLYPECVINPLSLLYRFVIFPVLCFGFPAMKTCHSCWPTLHHGLWALTETMAGSVDVWLFSWSFPGKDWLIWGCCIREETPVFFPPSLVTYFLSLSVSLCEAFLDSFCWTHPRSLSLSLPPPCCKPPILSQISTQRRVAGFVSPPTPLVPGSCSPWNLTSMFSSLGDLLILQ